MVNNWMNAQNEQWESSDPCDLWIGARVPGNSAPDPAMAAGSADLTEAGATASKWMCPSDNAIWTASANSAKREPERIFDRNQRIPTLLRPAGGSLGTGDSGCKKFRKAQSIWRKVGRPMRNAQ